MKEDFEFSEHCTELVHHLPGKELFFPLRERYIRSTTNLDGIQNYKLSVVDTPLPDESIPEAPEVDKTVIADAIAIP